MTHLFSKEGAVSGTRTRDPQLGKLMLYQLSYYRICECKYRHLFHLFLLLRQKNGEFKRWKS